MAAFISTFIFATAQAQEAAQHKLANVAILATGGTIAGSGATSTTRWATRQPRSACSN
jgi:L-asparaginase/glutamin-(asparagin-)ase